jgi:hypothetical protein
MAAGGSAVPSARLLSGDGGSVDEATDTFGILKKISGRIATAA